MLNKTDLGSRLNAAAVAGLLAPDQVAPLNDFLTRDLTPGPSPSGATTTIPGEEDLRFVRNFHDVFLATGIVILSAGLAVAIATFQANQGGLSLAAATQGIDPFSLYRLVPLYLGAAGILWGLGEIFSRKRRLFLPSIAICVSMTAFVVIAAVMAHWSLSPRLSIDTDGVIMSRPFFGGVAAIVASAAALLAASAFYLRFRLPFSMGLMGVFAVWLLIATVRVSAGAGIEAMFPFLFLVGGIALFAAAVWFDMRDPARGTRLSDNGFWLHFAAAPMILHGVLSLLGGGLALFGAEAHGPTLASAISALVVVAFLGLVSLLINRRALIVSALLTTGIAVGVLMEAVGLDAGALAASTLVVLGAGVLILGAGWHSARRALLKHALRTGVWARIFPPEDSLESAPRSVATA